MRKYTYVSLTVLRDIVGGNCREGGKLYYLLQTFKFVAEPEIDVSSREKIVGISTFHDYKNKHIKMSRDRSPGCHF